MATEQSIVDYLLEQIESAGDVRAKKMFGEYGLYCDEKIVALICDDELFIKPTVAGKTFIGKKLVLGEPYPGAKPYFLVSGDRWEDTVWLTTLIRITAAELPAPKPKPQKKKKR